MDTTDKQILSIINKGVAIAERPWSAVAQSVGVSEDEVVQRIAKLRDAGIIRRIGAVLDTKTIGWTSTLCAADVPDHRLKEYSAVVGSYEEVTHNYLRQGRPNCWFTVIAPDQDHLLRVMTEIEQKLGISLQSFPARKVFKIRVKFDLP
jgi:DNA-binding Lrp family transcriptional regulator